MLTGNLMFGPVLGVPLRIVADATQYASVWHFKLTSDSAAQCSDVRRATSK